MTKKKITFIILLFILTFYIWPTVNITATKTENQPKIDGILEPDIWQQAPVFSDFKMIEPDTGIPPTEKTTLQVLYSDKALFFGIYCYSKDPSAITCTSMQRDQREHNNDTVKILLDSFMDKRNAYVFYINPMGAKSDGIAFGEHASLNWDGIWDAKTRITKEGWSIEIKIPFKTISFNPNLDTWGLNLERWICKKMEKIRMEGISKDIFFNNPNNAGKLTNITKIKQGSGLTIRPYVTVDLSKDQEAGQDREFKLKFGGDIYKNFTPNLKGVFSYNTEFAETEVDTRQINLTRFSLFYPEKRGFFLEGSELFNFGIGLRTYGGSSFEPFFSRRIGLNEEKEIGIPILFGAKVFGKIKNTNIAILDVATKAYEGIPAKNFIAGRVYQNIFSQSKVGFLFTQGNPEGDSTNRMFGLDFIYSTSEFLKNKNLIFGGWWVYNWNELSAGDHQGYGFKIDYPNDLLDSSITYKHFGDSLEPAMGYLPRNGINNLTTVVRFAPRPTKGWIGNLVRRFNFMIFSNLYWNLNGELETRSLYLSPINFTTESGERIEFNIDIMKDTLSEEFEVSDGIIIPVGEYHYTRYKIELRTANHRILSGDLEYEFGDFYSGKIQNLQLGLNLQFNGYVNLKLESQFIKGKLPSGDFNDKLYRIKADIFLSPDIGLMNYIQYDDQSKELGVNIRFKYQLSPGNVIYLAYSKNWERQWDPISRFMPLQDRTAFKIIFTWRP